MVKHQKLQYYEPQLCLSCLTGIYGCRWKRYQRSQDDTTKWERFWFLILLLTFLMTLVWFYFWWEVQNDYNEFNWFLYNKTGHWSDWSIPILVTTAVGFIYITILLILALCHIGVTQQLNLHWLHKIGVVVIFIATIVAMASIEQVWGEEWDIFILSFQATAPFLHIGAIIIVSILAWLVAGQFARSEKALFQVFIFITYVAVVVALFLVPLTISSPCIMEKNDLGPRPKIIGHRGAPMLAPEHTLMSFQRAVEQKVYGIQADVMISYDGVPFLMHDRTLKRTTNVEEVFPQLAREHSSMFNWTELERLNAGAWFLKNNPFWTTSSFSDAARIEAGNQSLCKLTDLLQIAMDNNTALLLNVPVPPAEHPYRGTYINVTLQTILRSRIPQRLVIWLSDSERQWVREMAPGFQQATGIKMDVKHLKERGITELNLRYTQASSEDIRKYTSGNLSTNLYNVNEPWLYSVLWCTGVQSATSDAPHILNKMSYPVWIMSPDEYYLIWITADLISFTVILGVFILQKWRLGNIRTYNPEQIMLNAAVRRTSREVNIMKEKLIFSEISNGMDNTEELSMYSEHGYDGYSNEAVTPIDHPNTNVRRT